MAAQLRFCYEAGLGESISVGNGVRFRHAIVMSEGERPDKLAIAAAEEVLRTIFGDDLTGCNVSLDSIADLIGQAIRQRSQEDSDLIEMYEKLVEALDLLSTPPDSSAVTSPDQLRSLLGERLDAIHALTQRTQKTTRSLKALRKTGGEGAE